VITLLICSKNDGRRLPVNSSHGQLITGQLVTHVSSRSRITDFSYPRPFVPKNERSLWRTFVPQERKFQELSFPGTFVPGERKFPGTLVPGTFRTRELSFPLSDRPSRAALLCVLNYCMFGCDFTLMMLPPLWTSQLTLYVGRPAFAAHLSVFDGVFDVPITVSLRTKRLR